MAAVLDFIFLCYFVTHIPISIFIDSQVLLPKWIFPTQVRNTVMYVVLKLFEATTLCKRISIKLIYIDV